MLGFQVCATTQFKLGAPGVFTGTLTEQNSKPHHKPCIYVAGYSVHVGGVDTGGHLHVSFSYLSPPFGVGGETESIMGVGANQLTRLVDC